MASRRSFLRLGVGAIVTAAGVSRGTETTSKAAGLTSSDALAAAFAALEPGRWGEFFADATDPVLARGQSTGITFPFANSAPWNPVRQSICFVMGDHSDPEFGGWRRHIEFEAATNRFYLRDVGEGTHLYQNVAVNPYTGDQFLYVSGPADRMAPGWYEGGIFKYDEFQGKFLFWASVLPDSITNMVPTALSWWDGQVVGGGAQGALAWYATNSGTVRLLDPLTKKWSTPPGTTGQAGVYHSVMAFSKKHQRLVYGGGNGGGTANNANGLPDNRKLWAMDAAGNKVAMPDAPFHIGIWHGGNLVADEPTGNIHLIGFGQHYALNPVTARWTRLADPPASLLTPIGQGKPDGFVSCATPWGIVCIDGDHARTPKCRMWVYKSITAVSANYEGQWWNAPAGSESGWGLNLTHQGDVIFATWFTHDADRNARYLSMSAFQTGPNSFTGTLLRTTGPPLDADPFDPHQVQRIEVGSATLTFPDGNNGTFAYTVDGISQTKSITRQVFGPLPTCAWGGFDNLDVATNYQGLWWAAGGVESGWGISFTHQGDVIFATWFTYDFNGEALPLSATLTKVGPATYSGSLISTSGPSLLSAELFDPNAVTRAIVGTTTVTFSNGNAATFSYQVTLGSQSASGSKTIERLLFRPPGTVCQ